MKKPRKSEKILLENISDSARNLQQQQRGLEIGGLLTLIRSQLRISQQALAKRAKVPQATVSRIESGRLQPNISTLQKILSSIECDLLLTVIPKQDFATIRQKQAKKQAQKKVQYLQGTMSLEKQQLDQKLMDELVDDEATKLLESSGSELWEEEL